MRGRGGEREDIAWHAGCGGEACEPRPTGPCVNAWEARARVEITSWITCSIAHCVCAAATVLGMTLSLRPCTHLDVLPMNVFRQVPNASERISLFTLQFKNRPGPPALGPWGSCGRADRCYRTRTCTPTLDTCEI